jgi:heme exporter protein C
MGLWNWIRTTFHKFGSPKYFYDLAGRLIPWFAAGVVFILLPGIIWGLVFAPPDYYQGNSYRIIYIHVPFAGLAMSSYGIMAAAGIVTLVWRMKMADVVAKCIAPIGACFTFLCLVTGSLWGKPTWGTWWEWDARMTSMLILLFLYIGVMALRSAIEHPDSAARATAVLAVVGVVNLPIIRYSVTWWNTLHQPASITVTKSSMAPEMLWPLLTCILGGYCLLGLLLLLATRTEVLAREYRSQWVRRLLKEGA